jgi:hypothetical protein
MNPTPTGPPASCTLSSAEAIGPGQAPVELVLGWSQCGHNPEGAVHAQLVRAVITTPGLRGDANASGEPIITDSYSHSYDHFLANVGTAACRAALLQAQVRALANRATFEAKLAAEAKAAHGTFNDWVGGLDENFEVTVLATPFTFWQLHGMPPATAGSRRSLDPRRQGIQ